MEIRKILRRVYHRLTSPKKTNGFGNNTIESCDVSPQALKGHSITILKGAYVSEDCSIGSYSFIGFNSLISKSTIGRFCSIASNVNIGHGEHPINQISTSGFFIDNSYEVLTAKDCIIEHDVWIGTGSTIRRGVTIGTGAIIGANSFVNKNVPPYAIVVGSPAKIIKYRFEENKIKKILDSKWWEMELEDAKRIISELENFNNV